MLKQTGRMATPSKIDIVIDHNSVNFQPGEVVKGAVTFDLGAPITVNEIKLTCGGLAKVAWSVGFGDNATDYFDKENYINFEESIYERGKTNGKFQSGKHSFPFEILLPEDIPCSFEGPGCSIGYKITAVVIEEKKFMAETVRKLHFYVISNANVNLNEIPFTKDSVTKRATKEHRTCWGAGPVSATFSIDKRGYMPGEYITFRAQVENHTRVKLKPPEVKLYRAVIRRVRFGPDTTVESEVNIKLEKMKNVSSAIEKSIVVDWKNARLHVRPNTCPLISHCAILKVSYFVILDLKPFGLQVPIDITIGTIPLRGESMRRKRWAPETTTVSSSPVTDEEQASWPESLEDESAEFPTSTPYTDEYSLPEVRMPGKRLMKRKRSNLNVDTSEADSSYPHSDSENTSGIDGTQDDMMLEDDYNIGQDSDKLLAYPL